MVGDVLVVTVNQKTAGTSGRVPPRLQFEVTIIVGAASDAGVRKLHGLLGAHREKYYRVRGDTEPATEQTSKREAEKSREDRGDPFIYLLEHLKPSGLCQSGRGFQLCFLLL